MKRCAFSDCVVDVILDIVKVRRIKKYVCIVVIEHAG